MIVIVVVIVFALVVFCFYQIYSERCYISAKIVFVGLCIKPSDRGYFDVQYRTDGGRTKCKRIMVSRDTFYKYKIDDEILICVF